MAKQPPKMSEAQANYIRRAYAQAGLKPTDENLNRIMHKIFGEMADTQWFEISRERAHMWCERISQARQVQSSRAVALAYDPDRHSNG